jgi:chorismate dehydratase
MKRLATVSYLNARPLFDGIERDLEVEVVRMVPSRLLETLESGAADLALCPVIDFQRSAAELEIIPVGAIGCDGAALTVKLYSRKPIAELDEIAVDGDSHTSVALLRVVMHELFGLDPRLQPLPSAAVKGIPDALLLIGDKVITATPDRAIYAFELDLGAAWKEISAKPFVFATWLTRADSDLGALPHLLDRVRRRNRDRLARIAADHAQASGWPEHLAVDYLSRVLRYDLGEPELAGIEEFWRRCLEVGVIEKLRPMRLYGGGEE